VQKAFAVSSGDYEPQSQSVIIVRLLYMIECIRSMKKIILII